MSNSVNSKKAEFIDTTKYFGIFLVELAEKDKRVFFISTDSYKGSGASVFKEKFPERFLEFGIAEQNACGNAAGLAFTGKKPFYSAIANFITARCFEQIRNDIVRPGLNVILVGRAAGISYGPIGATHQAIEDLGILRVLPGMTIVDPADLDDFRDTIFQAVEIQGPIYFRQHKNLIKKINMDRHDYEIGKGVILKKGEDLFLISCGTMVYQSILASEILEKEGISAGVINMHTIKPLDEELIKHIIRKSRLVVTVEEHTIINGLGSAVADVLVTSGNTKLLKIGFYDMYPIDGPYMQMLEYHGLTGTKIAEKIIKFIRKKTL